MESMILIGEKINGFVPKTAAAIEAKDEEFIKQLAKQQADAGVDYLDCCPASNDEAFQTMEWLVGLIESACDTPICLDSPDPAILERSMGLVSRPGMLNSVSLAGGKTDKIFPLIAGTPWKAIAMLDDDSGIPQTADARVEVFKRLMDKADEFGISPDQLLVDPLVETLGTNDQCLLVFAETCREVKRLCPQVHITSGLSNISFGLPVRKMINIPFMILAMNAGMDSAIIDPLNRDLMGVIFGTKALLGEDEYCMEYLSAYRQNLFGPVK